MYKINLFQNLKSPQNPQTISIEDYIYYVKNGINQSNVLKGRNHIKGSKRYNFYKRSGLCVTHNFLFSWHKQDSNIISSTGLLYFDMDVDFDISCLDQSKIYIRHKSFGGKGDAIIVRTRGITANNFNESYDSIAESLGIAGRFDTSAKKKSQFTVVSYDPDLYFNPESYVFSASEKVSFKGNMSSSSNLPRNDTFYENSSSRIPYRTTNAGDYVNDNEEYQIFPDGIMTAKINIPRNIQIGNRAKILISIVNQVAALNWALTFDQILERALQINNIMTKEPLLYQQVVGIVKSIWRYKQEGTLKPYNNKMRKVIFNAKSTLSKEDKVSIVNKEVGKIKVSKTKNRIHDVIQVWNKPEKITQKKIAVEATLGLATVKRYWSEFDMLVKDINARVKSNNGSVT